MATIRDWKGANEQALVGTVPDQKHAVKANEVAIAPDWKRVEGLEGETGLDW